MSSEEPSASTAKSIDTAAIDENFVLLSAPDKFKDEIEGATSAPETPMNNHECLLLADTTVDSVPAHLENLLQLIDSSQHSQAELLFLLIYIVALESGFTDAKGYFKNQSSLCPVPSSSSFHLKNVLYLSRQKPTYSCNEDRKIFSMNLLSIADLKDASDDDISALLTAFYIGDLMIVTLSPSNSSGARGYSKAISVGRYVLSVQCKNKPLHQRFRKLDELSLVLRNDIFVPMRNQHLNWLSAGIIPSLESLPQELYENIFQYLTVKDIKSVANVCKALNGAVMNYKTILNKKRL